MARLEDKIAEIADATLRQVIAEDVSKLKKCMRFGLVFEEHQPEVVPLYGKRIKRGERVAKKAGSLTEIWRVLSVKDGLAHCEMERGNDGDAPVRETFDVKQLIVVRSMGEAIYPALTPIDAVQNGDPAQPHHILIEADNYHALQLMLFPYEGKVDCIYIDPPYNTGARDWKYNNDYVDGNDAWQHSKWLSMMKRRLSLAVRLLRPDGMMCITIDDYELAHLIMLLEDFPSIAVAGCVPIKNKPQGRPTARGFSVNHEYAIFVVIDDSAEVGRLPRKGSKADRYPETDKDGVFAWANFRKSGSDSRRSDRRKQYYPLFICSDRVRIPDMRCDNNSQTWVDIATPELGEEVRLYPILPIPLYAILTVDSEMKGITDEGRHGS
jgi:adenine-specific DNA-methyltransferase